MAGLIANLQLGTRALTAQSKGAEIAGKNLSNLNSTGYSRETISIEPSATVKTPQGNEGSGVIATDLQGVRDKYLDGAVLRENSVTGDLQAQQDVLSSAQTALGEDIDRTADSSDITATPTGATGIQSAVSNFFSSFQGLAATPTDPSARQQVLTAANELADRINTADTRLAAVQTDAAAQVTGDTQTVNGILKSIASLNAQIATAEIGNAGQAPELRDQRQAQLEKLSSYMNVTVTPDTAASGSAMQISVSDPSGNPVTLLQGSNVTGSVNFTGTGFQGGNPPTDLAPTGGSLQSRYDTSTQQVQAVRDNLKSLANQLTTAVNAAYNPSGSTGNLFATSPSGLIAVDPSVTTASLKATDSTSPGANELAVAVSNVANTTYSASSGDAITGTPSAYYASVVSGLGSQVSTSAANLSNQQLVASSVSEQRDSVSGVSLDEETTNLLSYQRAFEASARYVTTMDDLLNTVVNQMGVTQ